MTHKTPGIIIGNEPYLTITELSNRLNVTKNTVRNWVQKGKLPEPRESGLYNLAEVSEYLTRKKSH
jgi:excisionase family DNA binding protein